MKSKVAVVLCESYDKDIVERRLEEAVERLGGINVLLGSVNKILLKVNLLAPADPDQCITTHPSVLGATASILKKNGYMDLTYGDSPANSSFFLTSRMCRVNSVAREMNLKAGDFEHGSKVFFPQGRVCKDFYLAHAVQESDCIISIAKLKTHQLTGMTGAVKNQFGCICQGKSAYHRLYKNRYEFCQMLIDLNLLVKPKLFIMDAVYSMEGNGPYAGTPVETNLLLVSNDPVALDSVACQLVGIKEKYVPFLTIGAERGLGKHGKDVEIAANLPLSKLQKKIKTSGMQLSQVLANSFLKNFDFYRKIPVLDTNKCIGCKKCIEICPAPKTAIIMEEGDVKPNYLYKNCIKCYCCHEICPQKAISLKYFKN